MGRIFLTAFMLLLLAASTAFAAAPRVGVLYMNNARTTYDEAMDKKLLKNVKKVLSPKYEYVRADEERLRDMGMTDLAMAERRDIIDAFRDERFDYILCLSVEPLVRRERFSVFTQGIDITVTVPLKLIRVADDRYLYNGKLVEKQSDSTIIGSVGNKSVTLKALDKINKSVKKILGDKLSSKK